MHKQIPEFGPTVRRYYSLSIEVEDFALVDHLISQYRIDLHFKVKHAFLDHGIDSGFVSIISILSIFVNCLSFVIVPYMYVLYQNCILTAVTGVGSSPALATCETSQVLLAGVSGGFSRGSPVFAPPTDWPVLYELK